jgi:hypothetical protein
MRPGSFASSASTRPRLRRFTALLIALAGATVLQGCARPAHASSPHTGPWKVVLTSRVIRSHVQRYGINLGGQTFYDSGQMMRNLVFRNPGFEGLHYRSILHCTEVTATSCTTDNPDAAWPADFWNGATFRALNAPAAGHVSSSTAPSKASPRRGLTLTFSQPANLRPGEYIVVEKDFPGDPTGGWWTTTHGGASFSADRSDLSPQTPGRQALRIDAAQPGQSATLHSWFDSTPGHTFILLNGHYRVTFRAKDLSHHPHPALLEVSVNRGGYPSYLDAKVPLTHSWRNYTLDFSAAERHIAPANAGLSFDISGSSILLDDVSLETIPSTTNSTAFRAPVLAALRAFHPGVLRYMNSAELGSSLANELRPPFARERTGYSAWSTSGNDIPIGLGEFLTLCEQVHADPWIVVPTATSDAGAANLIQYLAGPASSTWGHLRQLVHHPTPWTNSFHRIHLEFGNEVWNSTFAGESISGPTAEGARATAFFHALRTAPGFIPAKFDLVLGGQSDYPTRNLRLLSAASQFDSFAIAPYLMHRLSDVSTPQAEFAPLLAEPEAMELPGGQVFAARTAAARKGVALDVYEVNLHTTEGSAPQSALDGFASSQAAGIALAEHLLRMTRDAGVHTAAVFSLPQYDYQRSDGKTVDLWGTVVDMGVTNRRRPQFLAAALANDAIGSGSVDELQASIEGGGPTLPVHSVNDSISISAAHLLDAFSFSSPGHRSLLLINLDLRASHSITLTGPAAPQPGIPLHLSRLTAAAPSTTNEQSDQVRIVDPGQVVAGSVIALPPLSMTLVRWRPLNP